MRQYGRRYRLEIGNRAQSIVIDNLAISFNIEKTISEEPNTSKIEIYNLNANNRNQIANKIFNQVKLFAGYDEPRLIFAGQITQAYTSRNDLDFITHIECGDGQNDYSKSRLYTTLKAGVKDSDVVNMCVKAMSSSKQGVVDLPKDKATKDVEEQRKQIIKEEQEYNANFAKEQSEQKFKPMQVKKKYETYDINKDQKFLYARELLNFKEKRGIDVLELMQKIDKKQILNKMV